MKTLTVKEAIARVNSGGNLESVVLEEQSIQQVNVRDAIVLASGGIVIPEERIYYDDADIQYDEEIDELTITSGPVHLSWEEKAKRAQKQVDQLNDEVDILKLHLPINPAIKSWLEAQSIPTEQLLTQLLEDFYRAQQLLKK